MKYIIDLISHYAFSNYDELFLENSYPTSWQSYLDGGYKMTIFGRKGE